MVAFAPLSSTCRCILASHRPPATGLCPLFVVAGKQDGIVPWQEGERLAAAASGPVVRCFIEDGNHVANNRVYRYRSQSADWMAQCLGLARHELKGGL
ncbi:MAG TPA: alpha/beta hydrolase [Burkholderiales bacterium]|nr:alpha/beta hydrolase [Burkholderiales bacterium]